ncbi:MAG: Gx transporter family protein [Synergistaceae bacterium]|jgi:heptaprenyl diphosphate synthase|nr:Gx transporter family protein [Synergistaceae bacterium]MCK9438172.1 Gx transporter family protein [Synergistaceae bacterium]MDD2351840.1 Gx transporter family protein [Synergistaceae bacterium]MDD3319499.1 Gx transporter family protein [Synergistaceae bacterium]MDD3964376.1 Gx transporter family protein [Synergistaceae bacterium]
MKLKNMIITGSLAAFALVFNMFEGSLPMPLPGIKLGAANVFSLLALVLLGVKEAFAVTLIRVFLAWVMTGNFFALLCSLAGGLMSASVMSFIYIKYRDDFSLPWISVAGAWAFNVAQVSVAALIVNDVRVLFYVVPLLAAGTAAGWAVGWLALLLCKRVGSLREINY